MLKWALVCRQLREENVWLEFGLLLVASYLIGSIPMGYIAVKLYRGLDIRQYGSGGIGGSNVFRNFSKPLGVWVFIYDFGKGALMVWIARLLDLDIGAQVIIGLAVVIGHNWPVFLHFNGGRGVATTLGVDFMLLPWLIPVFVGGAIFTLVLGSSPIPVLFGIALMPLASWIHHEAWELTLGLFAFFLLIVIRRLTAPGTDLSKTISTRELLLNRFLFDRDIRDGNEWKRFKRGPGSKKEKINK